MITKEQIKEIELQCAMQGHSEISIKDIAYLIVKRELRDSGLAYLAINGNIRREDAENLAKEYEGTERMQVLRRVMNDVIQPAKVAQAGKVPKAADITFEENKAALVEMLEKIEQAKMSGEIEVKDALKIEADIRTKLNDKFGTTDENDNHFIIIEKKFNSVCKCGREIYVPTKEDLMEKYHLVDDPEYAKEDS